MKKTLLRAITIMVPCMVLLLGARPSHVPGMIGLSLVPVPLASATCNVPYTVVDGSAGDQYNGAVVQSNLADDTCHNLQAGVNVGVDDACSFSYQDARVMWLNGNYWQQLIATSNDTRAFHWDHTSWTSYQGASYYQGDGDDHTHNCPTIVAVAQFYLN